MVETTRALRFRSFSGYLRVNKRKPSIVLESAIDGFLLDERLLATTAIHIVYIVTIEINASLDFFLRPLQDVGVDCADGH